MSMLGIKDIYDPVNSMSPAARTATTNGTGVDLANANANMVVYKTGAWTDGTHTPKLQDSADNSTFADVAAADQLGTFAAISSTALQNAYQVVSYIGTKRYIRAVVTRSGTTTGMLDSCDVILKYRKQP